MLPFRYQKGRWPGRCQCRPDDQNLKIHTFHSKRVLKIDFFVPKYTQRPPRQALGSSGSLEVFVQPMWGLGGLGFDPEAALTSGGKHTFHTNRAPKSHCLSRSTHQRHPSPAPCDPGPSRMSIKPILALKATRKISPGNGEMPCFALPSTGAEKSKNNHF